MSTLSIDDKKTTLYLDVNQEIIVSDANALKLRLITFNKNVQKTRDWITPASIFITILIALVTASFKDFIGVPTNIWESLFILSGILSFTITSYRVHTHFKIKTKCSVDYFIEELKKDSIKTDNQ